MKKILILAIVLVAVLSTVTLCCAAVKVFSGKSVKGSNNLVTRTIDAPAFEGVKSRQAVKVIITDRATDKITIEADDNLIDLIEVKVDDNTLKVGYKKDITNISNSNVTVTVPANGRIRSLAASSASSIVSEIELTADKFELDASSAAKIETAVKARTCEIETSSASKINARVTATECKMGASSASKIDAQLTATSCSVDASSAAKITIAGTAEKCSVELSSASKLAASEFVVSDYQIETSSGSSAQINCTKVLNASASSGSSVRYAGEGTGNIHSSSGGSIRRN